jgi:peptidyl-prolyl cis-trans isomerase SurA
MALAETRLKYFNMKIMKSVIKRFIPLILAGFLFFAPSGGQMMIDGIVAVVGDYTVLQSEIEQQLLQYQGTGLSSDELRCKIVEQFLQDKLLLDQAKIDSIEVTESTVEGELDKRLQYFIRQFGSREELEAYFNKSTLEIKEDFRQSIRDHLLAQKMQYELTSKIKITPSEVREFFNSLPADSIPFIDAKVEITQIVAYPPLGDEAIFAVRERLLELRKRIMDGDDFGTLAILYSEDGSAANEGEIGYSSQAELDPEYAKAAFGLKAGQVSKIVESQFGFHLIQLIDRRDDRVNTRHILIKPKISAESKRSAINRLDSLLIRIHADSLTFEEAALRFSMDKKSRLNSGLVINQNSNSSYFEYNELEPKDYLLIRDMKVGEISKPYETTDENNKIIYKIVKLKSRTDPHRANIKQDYVLLQNMALANKKNTIIRKWIQDKQTDTFIHLDPRYSGCSFIKSGWTSSISF